MWHVRDPIAESPKISLLLYKFLTVRGGSCWSVSLPCWSVLLPCRCRVAPCWSVALPWLSGTVFGHPCGRRVDSVLLPCSCRVCPCSCRVATGVTVVERPSTLENNKMSTDRPGSWSGGIRNYPGLPCWSVLIWDWGLNTAVDEIQLYDRVVSHNSRTYLWK